MTTSDSRLLGEIALIQQGRSPRKDQLSSFGKYPVIKVKDFRHGGGISFDGGDASFTDVNLGDRYVLEVGDSLILSAAHSSSIVGSKIGWVDHLPHAPKVFHTAEVIKLRPVTADLDPFYLFAALLSKPTGAAIKNMVKGGHLYASSLRELSIPLPAVTEQRTIAHVLRTVQRAKEQTEHVITACQLLLESTKEELFSSPRVEQIPVDQLCDVRGGKRLPKGHLFADDVTPYPYIRVVDFADGAVNVSAVRYLTVQDHERLRRYVISSEDVYVSIAGTIGLVGRIPEELDGAHLTENAAKLVIREQVHVRPTYLRLALSSRGSQNEMRTKASKSAQPKLSLAKLKSVSVPLVPPSQQLEIEQGLSAIERKIDAEEQRRDALDQLFNTLLRELMTGNTRLTDWPEAA